MRSARPQDTPGGKQSLRRSSLVTPCDLNIMTKAARTEADVIRLELEDGVAPDRKAEARAICARGLREIDWGHREAWVRICHFSFGFAEADVDALVAGRADLIMMGKVQGPEDILRLDALVTEAEARHGVPPGSVRIGCVIERIRAVSSVEDIAACSPRMSVLQLGLDDLSLEYGYRLTRRPADAPETLYTRSRVVLASRMAGISCLDYSYVNFHDVEGSEKDARFSAQLGFDGKSTISPRQIATINRAFLPTEREIEWATRIVDHVTQLADPDQVVYVIDGAMVDAPHVQQARNILKRAAVAEAATTGAQG